MEQVLAYALDPRGAIMLVDLRAEVPLLLRLGGANIFRRESGIVLARSDEDRARRGRHS